MSKTLVGGDSQIMRLDYSAYHHLILVLLFWECPYSKVLTYMQNIGIFFQIFFKNLIFFQILIFFKNLIFFYFWCIWMTSYHAKFIPHKHWGISKNETHVPNGISFFETPCFFLPYDSHCWLPHKKEKKK